ncbi:MAG: ATP-binding protein [Syntrophomonadaceae bacterium]
MKFKPASDWRSFFWGGSLRVQLLSRTLLLLAFLLVLIGVSQYWFMREVVYKNEASILESRAMSIVRATGERFEPGAGNGRDVPPQFFIPGASVALIDEQGNFKVLASEPNESGPPQLEASEYQAVLNSEFRPDDVNYRVVNSGGRELLVVLKRMPPGPGRDTGGVVQLSTPTAHLQELLMRQLLTFLLLALAAMLVGLLAYLPVIKRTLLPLSNMINTAGQIDSGNLDRRFPVGQGQEEIDHLAQSCNGMLERLEASFAAELETKEQMRRFIADASHELRTPLTSIHGFLEVLLRGAAQQPDQLEKALKNMHSESQRLNKLVHDLLLLSKLDRTPHLEISEGSLGGVIRDMEPQLRILAGSRELILNLDRNLESRFNTDQIKQVILNLFQNAVQHTDPETGRIQISTAPFSGGVELAIEDNGPGIAEEHLIHVFDRFYRSDSARTRKYGGAGLGLSISKSIIDAHGGSIQVSSQAGRGCTFKVWLPG